MREIEKRVQEKIGEERMKIMLFADDIFVWGKNKEELQEQINEWVNIAAEYGLNFSAEKSEVVILKCESQVEGDVVMNGTPLKQVDHFKYLGSIISEDGTFDKEINRRIQQGSAFYNTEMQKDTL
uniref:Reverse transcriptase domain-containing protein n=1 Tax=Cacopsylla melanoneura TaxID=428564 RepID=A0A8D8S2A0_9HEMI